jgi:predicted nucleic acid-binding protein
MALDPLSTIPTGATVVVDSAPIIYFLEDHPTLGARFAALFERVAQGELSIVTSAISLAEVLAGPLSAGNEVLAEQYRVALTEGAGWSVHPVTASLAVVAARFRAKHRLKLPDAIQLATVVDVGAYALVTHDRDFGGVKDLRVID